MPGFGLGQCISFIIIHRLCKGYGVRKEKELAHGLNQLTRLLQIICTPFTFFIRIPVLKETEEVTEEDLREMISNVARVRASGVDRRKRII